MSYVEEKMKELLSDDDYGLWKWAENKVHNSATTLQKERPECQDSHDAYRSAIEENIGAARIYWNGIHIFQGKWAGDLRSKECIATEKAIGKA